MSSLPWCWDRYRFAARRTEVEWYDLYAHPADFFSAGPDGYDLFHWNAALIGPAGSPFEGGLFFLEIEIPPDYPEFPPEVYFTTPIFHPNINPRDGSIALDILDKQWALNTSMTTLMLAISTLLCEPNLENPLIPDIAKLCKSHREEYNETARTWTKKYSA